MSMRAIPPISWPYIRYGGKLVFRRGVYLLYLEISTESIVRLLVSAMGESIRELVNEVLTEWRKRI